MVAGRRESGCKCGWESFKESWIWWEVSWWVGWSNLSQPPHLWRWHHSWFLFSITTTTPRFAGEAVVLLAGAWEAKGGALKIKKKFNGWRDHRILIFSGRWYGSHYHAHSNKEKFQHFSQPGNKSAPFPHISVSLFIFCARHSLNKTQEPNNHKKSFRWCTWSDWLQKIERRLDFFSTSFPFHWHEPEHFTSTGIKCCGNSVGRVVWLHMAWRN